MIDDKKIENTAKVYMIGEFYDKDEAEWNYPITNERKRNQCIIDFKAGAKWAINEFLKDLLHPASEVPRNDYTDILVVCKDPQRPIVLSPEDILDGTPDDIASYNDMWMHLCDVYRITKFCYIGDLLPKTKKGCNHD